MDDLDGRAEASDQTNSLGDKLRKRRRELGLTLAEVATGAGLTAGFISQIERGITAPSLSSLVSVSQVLDMHVSNFLSQPGGDKAITRHDERAVYSVGDNIMSYERLSSNFAGSQLRSVIVHEPPGYKAEPISHDGEEMIFILQGKLTVEIEGTDNILETGDSIHFQSTRVHSSWNHTDRKSTILWVGTMDVFGDGDSDPDPIHRNGIRRGGASGPT
jgi:transcriptional regulator with XRE-family HTH domain